MSNEKTRARQRLERCLGWQQAVHDPVREPRNRLPVLPGLRRFQHRRLEAGFTDLLADARMRPAAEFFLSDLYGEQDFSERDRSVARVAPIMARLMPLPLLVALGQAVELGALSHSFDLKVAQALDAEGVGAEEIDADAYQRAYREAGCPRLRDRQIALVEDVGHTLDRAVHTMGVERLLRISRLPARAAGVLSLQAFLERGFEAFRQLDGAGDFLDTIASRERAVSARLFEGHPEPFGAAQVNSRSR